MAGFRGVKAALAPVLADTSPDWSLEAVWSVWDGAVPGMEAVGPLFAFLSAGETAKWHAVAALGQVTGRMAGRMAEGEGIAQAREVVRRLMWRLNEDSGNLGWGGAEAMGEILAVTPSLAAEYSRILFSYVRDTGHADNFLDHAPLRAGAYWGIGRLAAAYAPSREEAEPLLLRGLADESPCCRAVSAWGVGKLAAAGAFATDGGKEAAQAALASTPRAGVSCALLDGIRVREEEDAGYILEALAALNR